MNHFVAMAEMQIGAYNNRQRSTAHWLNPIPGSGAAQEHGLDVLVTFRSGAGTTILCRYDKRNGTWAITG